MDIANMRFESYAGKHAILIDTVGTYKLTDVFFDQSGTADIETTHTTGTVTINLVGTTLTPSITNTGGGTVVLNFPNRVLTLNNIVAGSRILVTDTTNTVVLFNEVPSTSPFVGSIASAGSDVDLSIRVRNGTVPYKTFDTTATLVKAGVTINVNQVSDV